jgi:hypothetical protein
MFRFCFKHSLNLDCSQAAIKLISSPVFLDLHDQIIIGLVGEPLEPRLCLSIKSVFHPVSFDLFWRFSKVIPIE